MAYGAPSTTVLNRTLGHDTPYNYRELFARCIQKWLRLSVFLYACFNSRTRGRMLIKFGGDVTLMEDTLQQHLSHSYNRQNHHCGHYSHSAVTELHLNSKNAQNSLNT
jgi:hypothetical protein